MDLAKMTLLHFVLKFMANIGTRVLFNEHCQHQHTRIFKIISLRENYCFFLIVCGYNLQFTIPADFSTFISHTLMLRLLLMTILRCFVLNSILKTYRYTS